MLDGRFMAQAGASTVQHERDAALQYAASFHRLVEERTYCEELEPKSKEKWIFVNKKREAMKHQTEWCETTNKYRCMRCGRSGKNTRRCK